MYLAILWHPIILSKTILQLILPKLFRPVRGSNPRQKLQSVTTDKAALTTAPWTDELKIIPKICAHMYIQFPAINIATFHLCTYSKSVYVEMSLFTGCIFCPPDGMTQTESLLELTSYDMRQMFRLLSILCSTCTTFTWVK